MAVGAILGQKPQIPLPVDTVQQGNMNAVTSNAVYEAIQAIPEPSGEGYKLIQDKFPFQEWHMETEQGTFVRIVSTVNIGSPSTSNVNPNSSKTAYNSSVITGIKLPPNNPIGGSCNNYIGCKIFNKTLNFAEAVIDNGSDHIQFKTVTFNVGATIADGFGVHIGENSIVIEYFVPNA